MNINAFGRIACYIVMLILVSLNFRSFLFLIKGVGNKELTERGKEYRVD